MTKLTLLLALIFFSFSTATINYIAAQSVESEDSSLRLSLQRTGHNSSSKLNESDIGNLIVLDRLFDEDREIFDKNGTSLGDLLVLNAIFNEHEISSTNNQYTLGDLFILDELFDQTRTDTLDKDYSSLSDLLILNQIFNKSN